MQDNTTDNISQPKQSAYDLKYLPKDPQQRQQLKQDIQNYITHLTNLNQNNNDPTIQEKIKKLEMRLVLIDGCQEMSLLRLDHLEAIFKHYCTHIFKTGKHMTFQRLEYEKVHLTMERFFLFIRDFELTLMKNGEKKEEVVEKNDIILFFKKISSNCRDLSFEQFISCIQKLALVYYDEREVFHLKKQRLKQQRQKRKEQLQKRRQRKLKLQLQHQQKLLQKPQQPDKAGQVQNQNQQQNQQNAQQKHKQQQQQFAQQNDDLVKQLMNNKDIENPNEEVEKIVNIYAAEGKEHTTPTESFKFQPQLGNEQNLLILTNQEKIEYFYKFMIRVDSVNEYRDKLTALNLPIFQKGRAQSEKISKNQSKTTKTTEDQAQRLEQLKKKMEEKKLKRKASPIPKHKDDGTWAKAQQEKKRKKQLKKERQEKAKQKNKFQSDALLQKKLDSQKQKDNKEKKSDRPQYNEKQLDWNTLGKLSIDQLKINKFNPHKYFSRDDDDKIFLDEYQEGSRTRIASGLDVRERNSKSIVEDVKKRVGEVQRKQKKQERQLQSLSRKIVQTIPLKNRN